MSSVLTFQSRSVRVHFENAQVMFVAKDVCAALNISWSGSKILSNIPESWKGVVKLTTPRGGWQRFVTINEAATYKLAFRSNKPEADAFTNWVASEVLPSIRKTGKFEIAPKQVALPSASNAVLACTPKWYQMQLESIWNSFDERAYEFRRWMMAVHNELGRVTGPMYKDILYKLTRGNHHRETLSLDLPIASMHRFDIEAIEQARDSICSMYDAINLARKYARMLEM